MISIDILSRFFTRVAIVGKFVGSGDFKNS
jgi:hypothetical protein